MTGKLDRGTLVYTACSLVPAVGILWSERPLAWSLILFLSLWPLAFSDWRSLRLPNLLNLTFFVVGLLFVARAQMDGAPAPWRDHIIGAAAGLLFIVVLDALYQKVRGRTGIGMGDAKLLAGIGLWLGWQALPFVLLAASLCGLAYGLLSRSPAMADDGVAKLPFGTFLCLATWTVWLFL